MDGVGVRRLELLHRGKKWAEMAARNEEAAEDALLLVLLLIKLHPRVSRGGCALRDGLSSGQARRHTVFCGKFLQREEFGYRCPIACGGKGKGEQWEDGDAAQNW